MMTDPIPLALNRALDATALAKAFARDGRVQIADFLEIRAAEALHAMLRARDDWVHVVNSGEKTFELSRPARAAMSADQREALDTAVYAGARSGFQYRYETIRVPDAAAARAASDDPLAAFAAWLSSGAARDLLRQVTGAAGIDFADAQATAYAPGDFLTGHDDDVVGKHRHAAYVFGLTPVWRTEWGGLLLFHGHAVHGYAPAFNTLNLFAVPQVHSVSEVTRAAAYRRYSITGWLRSAQ
ncbi:2OG-Fe(II) oxygenase family protein [Sphingomonas sp.]|uniref:2OG-Fe(II) oxygenase n=1 Tax=Sphingomonas sp. TaxID=28214 RepID=UPI0025CE5EE8|nr:2OG-Fe(II) oxygenase family protein [Sphingomonas sp.]